MVLRINKRTFMNLLLDVMEWFSLSNLELVKLGIKVVPRAIRPYGW